ncbi:hypothetical protein ACFRCI_23650 [Streptomyces sp. NPDC056638]|uniref:hypothetical protein n=1 Tax=Streptomyces sp. NPDC056638 TaxID=3345887 RepID=UPI0036A1BC72
MTDYVARCRAAARDTIRAMNGGETVALYPSEGCDSVYLPPTDARIFARGILALADEIDGGEAEETASDSRPKVGDRLRVTKDNPRFCPVVTGDVITVVGTDYDHDSADCVRFLHGDDAYRWIIPLTAVEKVADEPEAATPADTSASPESYRASLLAQARDMMRGRDYTAADLIDLAAYLAG